MKPIILALPGNELLATAIANKLDAAIGDVTVRHFPDGESYIRIHDEVKGKKVVLVCSLHRPDVKIIPLYFLSKTAKDLGAKCTCLVSPYLPYMRQDKIFKKGEGITANYFATLISQFTDSLITVDPHLHRIKNLNEIYGIPTKVVHAADRIARWIKEHVDSPVLIGPDSESKQWVSEVAKNAAAPFIVLKKTRYGDRNIEISIPQVEAYKNHTPVLVDDIISTAGTMIKTIGHLKKTGMKPAVCIGIHAVFAPNAYEDLKNSGAEQIVTCNTIPHESNAIDLNDLYLDFIEQFEPTPG